SVFLMRLKKPLTQGDGSRCENAQRACRRMTVVILADAVIAQDEDDYRLIIFGEGEPGSGHYLMLQRAHQFDEQAVRLGQDTYYIERDDQGMSAYGGVERFELSRAQALVKLNEKASAKMDNESEIVIRFNLDDQDFQNLKAAIERMFAGCGCLT